MATRAKKAGAAGKQYQHPSLKVTDLPQYVRLRTLLDSADVGALRYYLNAPTGAEQKEHFEQLRSLLMQIIELAWAGEKLIDCPPGYTDCGGCCVPYACPE